MDFFDDDDDDVVDTPGSKRSIYSADDSPGGSRSAHKKKKRNQHLTSQERKLKNDQDAVRSKICLLFCETLKKGGASDDKAYDLGVDIENALYEEYCSPMDAGYQKQVRSLKFNLENNDELMQSVLSETITPQKLSVMSSDEMARKEVAEWREEQKKNYLKDHVIIQAEEVKHRLVKTRKGEMIIHLQPVLNNNKLTEEGGDSKHNLDGKQTDTIEDALQRERTKDDAQEWLASAAAAMEEDSQKLQRKMHVDVAEDSEEDVPALKAVKSPVLRGASPVLRGASPRKDSMLEVEPLELNPHSPQEDDDDPEGPTTISTDAIPTTGAIAWQGTLQHENKTVLVDARHLHGLNVGSALPSQVRVVGSADLDQTAQYVNRVYRSKDRAKCLFLLEPTYPSAALTYAAIRDFLSEKRRVGVLFASELLLYMVPPSDFQKSISNNAQFKAIGDIGEGVMLLLGIHDHTFDLEAWKIAHADMDAIPIGDDDDGLDFGGTSGNAADDNDGEVSGTEEQDDTDPSSFSLSNQITSKKFRFVEAQIGNIKIPSFKLEGKLVRGGKEMIDIVPDELNVKGRTPVSSIVSYVSSLRHVPSSKRAIVELEPDEDGEEAYLALCDHLDATQKAAVVLSSSDRLVYLLPPTPETASLYDPPVDACDTLVALVVATAMAVRG